MSGARCSPLRDGYELAAALKRQALDAGVELLAPAIAIGLFEQGFVPVAQGNLLLKFRAHRVVVASGVVEQPLVFPGNDLIGVMLPDGVRRLVNYWSIKPGEQAVVLTADDRGLAGRRGPRGCRGRARQGRRLPRDGAAERSRRWARGGRVASVGIDGRWLDTRPARDVGEPAAELQAARPGRRPGRVRRAARHLRPDRPA